MVCIDLINKSEWCLLQIHLYLQVFKHKLNEKAFYFEILSIRSSEHQALKNLSEMLGLMQILCIFQHGTDSWKAGVQC